MSCVLKIRKMLFTGSKWYVTAVKTLVDGNAKALGFPIGGLCTFAGAVLMDSRVLHLLVRGGGCTPQEELKAAFLFLKRSS